MTNHQRPFPLLLGLAALTMSCAGAAPSTPGNTQPQPLTRQASQQPAQIATAVPPPSTTHTQEPSSPKPSTNTASPQPAPNPLHIQLPSDPQWANAPLPPFNPNQYINWRQTGIIHVGKSHLQQGDLIDDGRLALVMSGMEASVRVYNRTSRRLVGNYKLPGLTQFARTDFLAWPGNGSKFVLSKPDGTFLFNASNGEAITRLSPFHAWQLQWSPDRQILVGVEAKLSNQTSVMKIFRRSGENKLDLLGTIDFAERVDGWDLSRDNRFLAVTYYPSNTVSLIDLHKGAVAWRLPAPAYANSVAISPDGQTVAIGGASLMLINASDPTKRTSYTHFGNNIAQVAFSPSADAIFASAYEGKIRVFSYDSSPPKLRLVKTLHHIGRANVYALRFFHQGAGLMSTSGDKTVRFWGAPRHARPGTATGPHSWSPPFPENATYAPIKPKVGTRKKATESPATLRKRAEQLQKLFATPRHHPQQLDAPAKSSRIVPGKYACRVSKEYKMRDCEVTKNSAGHTMLEIKKGNLIAAKGVLFDDGSIVRFEGWLTDRTPFQCLTCQERCFLRPNECACTFGPLDRIASCLRQPIYAAFRGNGGHWRGILIEHDHTDDTVRPPSKSFRIKSENNQFVVELRKRPAR